jgi:Abnormal spindle-like microcephaly-assoc'd, ASPM-SPD-2-Hydin
MLPLLLACTPVDAPEPKDSTPVENSGLPAMAVSPVALDFGLVQVGEVARQSVTVANSGEVPLHLSGLVFAGPGDPFVVAGLESDQVLPGASVGFTVAFAPLLIEPFEEELRVESDDPVTPALSVSLRGQGEGPVLRVLPEHIQETHVYLGCSRVTAVDVANVGSTPLTIRSIDYTSGGPEFALDLQEFMNGPLPWTLEAQQVRQLLTVYTPAEVGADSATLRLDSDDPVHPVHEVSIAAEATIYASFEDNFVCTEGASCELFSLSAWPAPGHLWVEVDGVALTEGWMYRVGDNKIQFSGGAIPQVGQTIRVSYYQQGDCWE